MKDNINISDNAIAVAASEDRVSGPSKAEAGLTSEPSERSELASGVV